MARLTWVGGTTGDWFAPSSWSPQAVPASGDDLTIASGTAGITPTDPALPDPVQVTLGSTDFSMPAGIQASDAAFGAGFRLRCRPARPMPNSI